MQWSPIARKECRAVLTSKGVWLLAIVVVLWGFRPTYAGWGALGKSITAGYVQISASIFLPLGALLLGYQTIIGERTTGSLKFLLALPLTRTDILVGKVAGRVAGVCTLTLVTSLVLAVAGLVTYGLFSIPRFVGVVCATFLLVAILVAIAVSISAVTDRTVTAAAATFAFFLLTLFWTMIVQTAYSAITGVSIDPFDPPASGPLFLALRLTPTAAYNVLTNWILGVGNSADFFDSVYSSLQPSVSTNVYVVGLTFSPGTVPWYLNPALSLVILLAWLVVPLGLARLVFARGDAL